MRHFADCVFKASCDVIERVCIAIFKAFGMFFPNKGLLTGSFMLDLAVTMFLVTYASDMLALMVSCLAHTPMTAMTIMPFLLVVQLVFAGGVFPLEREGAKMLSKFTVSNWGIQAVNIAADVNSQPSIALTAAINTLSDPKDELMVKIHNVMEIEEVRDKLQAYTSEKMQDPVYTYSKDNLLKCWGILALFALIYALIGLIFLERVDKDKR